MVAVEEAVDIFRRLGDERMSIVHVVNLGFLAAREGRSDEAEALLREGLEYAGPLVDKKITICAWVSWRRWRSPRATRNARPG